MSQWCDECKRSPYVGCDKECPVFGLNFDELAEKYIKAINKLKYLKACAETVDAFEDDIIDDYRYMAEHDMREIIDMLLEFDFGDEKSND